jgi:hypothetical protein
MGIFYVHYVTKFIFSFQTTLIFNFINNNNKINKESKNVLTSKHFSHSIDQDG